MNELLQRISNHSFELVEFRESNIRAALVKRQDQKYLLPVALLDPFLANLQEGYQLLANEGQIGSRYQTTYFDTPDLTFFQDHLKKRRKRYKIRIREYSPSGETMLEIKLKTDRGHTNKKRLDFSGQNLTLLDNEDKQKLAVIIQQKYQRGLPDVLQPSLLVSHERFSFVGKEENVRVTIDYDLAFARPEEESATFLVDDFVLVETKSKTGHSQADKLLAGLGVKAQPLSKYCVGILHLYEAPLRGNRFLPAAKRAFTGQRAYLDHPSIHALG